ncbi:MAG: amidohydrolase family protein, partial [Bacteroidetes bacterium]|nr:amidohydrolase family protein [Bacteroidota bacterium]
MKRQVRALVVFLPLLLTACSTSTDSPDLVLLNGIVFTVDEAQPWAEAIAISGEYITAVGSVTEIQGLAGSDTRTIDLYGAFVTAGFNDAHVHVSSTGALIVGVNLLDVHEPVAFADRIQAATERLPTGSLISGGSWG